jgi:hypothetical protein
MVVGVLGLKPQASTAMQFILWVAELARVWFLAVFQSLATSATANFKWFAVLEAYPTNNLPVHRSRSVLVISYACQR